MKEERARNNQLELWEEIAFYESGLSAHGCAENLDSYALKAIKAYGRHLLTMQEQHLNGTPIS